MTKTPKVSITILTYNRSNYLNETIESALIQDYENLEVIVSDNASTDNTSEIIGCHTKNKRFKYFRNLKNIGLTSSYAYITVKENHSSPNIKFFL